MKSESDPITPDEFLIRRVHKGKLQSDGQTLFVAAGAFQPRMPTKNTREPDIDGISLYRESCLQSISQILGTIPPDKLADIGLVRVPVSFLQQLELTIKPVQTDIPGHVVIHELRCDKYVGGADKLKCDSIINMLAEEASRIENLALLPPSLQHPTQEETARGGT